MTVPVDQLFEEFIAADRSGAVPDPSDYLARADDADRAELTALLDAYLARAPRRAVFEGSPAARAVTDALTRSLSGTSGTWPAVLPRLRDRARLRRSELVSLLARELGVADREAKVAGYYHAMEQGTLPASGVSDRVLESLGRIVGESAAALRAAGAALTGPPPAAPSAPAFARVAVPAPEYGGAPAAAALPAASLEEPDEVDELFTGG